MQITIFGVQLITKYVDSQRFSELRNNVPFTSQIYFIVDWHFTKCTVDIHHRQIFSGGVSDQNENLVGKFFARLRRAKKGVPKFFACGGLFSLWRH